MLNLTFGKKSISTDRNAFVMGIVNATPDSFYSRSRSGIDYALKLIDEGADIIDVGGESTRPGFIEVPVDEEIKRIVPIINEISKKSDVVISVDTRKKEVLQAAFEYGADILNDVSALKTDSGLASVAANLGVSVVLMQGYNVNENHTNSIDIVDDVKKFLVEQADYAISQGIKKEKIIFDPGIGFGKTEEENISLLKNTDKLICNEYPLLMALSRKRIIGKMTNRDVEERLSGTISANLFSVIKGAKILRVHDVKDTIDSLNVMKYIF